ncbi:GntR family transcriptional regulator [Cellulomonas sp. PhB143]|uniref:GntR family transcriptional regulator n=1 Tax=Cellulomonas sp. PhB143 TaxID=2485186 RepID=UPI000F483984|nr:GntR family transcriptional regulator [Cellulomonas sp. PhB143]ROS75495.1 GntR family transcriptional regulator [Cellulomonas sp. PhB143]
MSLAITIDLTSTTPHYEQVRSQIAALITAGELTDGQRLPTVRALANDLGIAPGTIARTYRDLEAAGLVTTRRRIGTLVTAPPAMLDRAAVTEAAQRFVTIARDHNLTDVEIRDLVSAAILNSARSPTQPRGTSALPSAPEHVG